MERVGQRFQRRRIYERYQPITAAGALGQQFEIYVQMKSQVALPIGILVLGLVAGCNDSGLPIVPVYGKVTFAGGSPPKGGSITFSPIQVAEGLPSRPGTASFDESGKFQVTSFQQNDGLVPGTYQASLDCWMQTPYADDPTTFERFNHVPKTYQPPPITVSADADEVEVNFDVPPKKK